MKRRIGHFGADTGAGAAAMTRLAVAKGFATEGNDGDDILNGQTRATTGLSGARATIPLWCGVGSDTLSGLAAMMCSTVRVATIA